MEIAIGAVLIYAVIRSAVLGPNVARLLEPIIELSTPVSSFARLQEGWFLFTTTPVSPYESDLVHHSPLLLVLLSLVPKKQWSHIFTIADVGGALSLAIYAKKHAKLAYPPIAVALVYLLNPFSLLGSAVQSTNVLSNAMICGTLGAAACHKTALSMMLLAFATALNWYPLYLLPSVLVLNSQNTPEISQKRLVLTFGGMLAAFMGLAYLPLQSWQFLSSQFGTLFFLQDLTQPNIGLWWYLFIEVFEVFRPFFLGVFQLFLVAFLAPLLLRFPEQPLFQSSIVLGLLAIFKPYPEAADVGLFLSVLALNKPVLELMENRFVGAMGMLYVSILGPVFYYLWIYLGSGNANFYYAITLVYAVTLIVVLGDATWAAIRLDYDGGKTKLTQM